MGSCRSKTAYVGRRKGFEVGCGSGSGSGSTFVMGEADADVVQKRWKCLGRSVALQAGLGALCERIELHAPTAPQTKCIKHLHAPQSMHKISIKKVYQVRIGKVESRLAS